MVPANQVCVGPDTNTGHVSDRNQLGGLVSKRLSPRQRFLPFGRKSYMKLSFSLLNRGAFCFPVAMHAARSGKKGGCSGIGKTNKG